MISPSGANFAAAGVGEQDVDPPVFLLDRGVEPVEVRQLRDVALHADRAVADLRDRLVEFRLPASGDDHLGAFGREPPGCGQADATVAAGDDRDFPFELPAMFESSEKSGVRAGDLVTASTAPFVAL